MVKSHSDGCAFGKINDSATLNYFQIGFGILKCREPHCTFWYRSVDKNSKSPVQAKRSPFSHSTRSNIPDARVASFGARLLVELQVSFNKFRGICYAY